MLPGVMDEGMDSCCAGAPLGPRTTFGVGGGCDEWREASTADEASGAIRAWAARGLPWRVLGGGSNVLVADDGVRGGVLHIGAGDGEIELWRDGAVACPAGAALDAVVARAVAGGAAGSERWAELSGIPGTVGGAVCGNAGAFGVQMSDFVEQVEVVGPDGAVAVLPAAALAYGYRTSALQAGGRVVTKAWLRGPAAAPNGGGAAADRRAEILALRRTKHPAIGPGLPGTAGSFFRNLPATEPGGRRRAAGALLEAVGAKEMRVGGAYVFERHANILMAGPGATAANVQALADALQAAVEARFGVRLAWEVRLWGPPRKPAPPPRDADLFAEKS